MRSLFAAASLASALLLPLASAAHPDLKRVQILDYNREAAYTRFALPCPPTSSYSGADESIVFSVQVNLTDDHPSDLIVNGRGLGLDWTTSSQASRRLTGHLSLNSSSGSHHVAQYTAVSHVVRPEDRFYLEGVTQHFAYHIHSLDTIPTESFGFLVNSQPADSLPLRSLILRTGVEDTPIEVDFAMFTKSNITDKSVKSYQDTEKSFESEGARLDLTDELDTLHLLETAAENLRTQIASKKQVISTHLREQREHEALRQLLKECDGLVCAARVVAQRICDKVGLLTGPSSGYAKVQGHQFQPTMALYSDDEKPQQASRNCTKSKMFAQHPKLPTKDSNGTAKGFNVPLILTKNGTAHEYDFKDFVKSPNSLVRALQIIATVLGIAALIGFIRRKCMSMRKRVERAADREERRNARAYRRAARRAEMRRRWDNFVSAVNCFSSPPEARFEDYEEKRALILQDAFLEQLEDLDMAEKGEVMEAEIRELRHAHEIVASLVRVEENRYDLVTPIPVNDPPPPLVPLPYTPASRSRASTSTLPSYTSESLPDYSSRPETLRGSSVGGSVMDGFSHYTPSTSEGEGRNTPPSVTSSGRTRYTPVSSILDVSPRVSEETLRTRRSKDTQDS